MHKVHFQPNKIITSAQESYKANSFYFIIWAKTLVMWPSLLFSFLLSTKLHVSSSVKYDKEWYTKLFSYNYMKNIKYKWRKELWYMKKKKKSEVVSPVVLIMINHVLYLFANICKWQLSFSTTLTKGFIAFVLILTY